MGLFKRIFQRKGKPKRCEFLNDKGKCVPPDERTGPLCTYQGKNPKAECHVYPIQTEKLAFKHKMESIKADLGIREFRKRLAKVRDRFGSDVDAQRVLVAQELARSIPRRDYRKSPRCPLVRAKGGGFSPFDVVRVTFTKEYVPICHACEQFWGFCVG